MRAHYKPTIYGHHYKSHICAWWLGSSGTSPYMATIYGHIYGRGLVGVAYGMGRSGWHLPPCDLLHVHWVPHRIERGTLDRCLFLSLGNRMSVNLVSVGARGHISVCAPPSGSAPEDGLRPVEVPGGSRQRTSIRWGYRCSYTYLSWQ